MLTFFTGSVHKYKPSTYFKYFTENNVKLIIRLSEKQYKAEEFIAAGFAHKDLFIRDGYYPSEALLEEFFRQVENTNGAVAVHCYGRNFFIKNIFNQ